MHCCKEEAATPSIFLFSYLFYQLSLSTWHFFFTQACFSTTTHKVCTALKTYGPCGPPLNKCREKGFALADTESSFGQFPQDLMWTFSTLCTRSIYYVLWKICYSRFLISVGQADRFVHVALCPGPNRPLDTKKVIGNTGNHLRSKPKPGFLLIFRLSLGFML